MAKWDELKPVLRKLAADPSQPLSGWPDPSVDTDRYPPFGISLEAWAVDVAADLHAHFGDDLHLTVGGLPYPDTMPPTVGRIPRPLPRRDTAPLLPADEIGVSFDQPAVVRSGHDLSTALRVHNHRPEDIIVKTNGQLTALVVNPNTAEIIGGSARAQRMPEIDFHIAEGDSRTIPLIIGTASMVRSLGYAVPPGSWPIEIPITLGDRSSPMRRDEFRTPLLPITVVP